ncbi:MAG: ankyrin repeat domain-containing protein [Azonexus sp.]|uniref:ankyrin repeat domain-containing protein n=1 Tax=Azonexus sp. TaxID=1872668 RepID=UPI00283058C9|nr:ankyrin repeat domain-containing protein [Azonexus sp.]MDR0777363.1 ankyrin repeat domain-containing protein [Azonexus sp.]
MRLRSIIWGLLLARQIVVADARPPVDYKQLIDYIKNGQTAQFKAELAGRTREDINLSGRTVLMASAIASNQADAVDALLDWGMDPNRALRLFASGEASGVTPLLLAISSRAGPDLVKRLIARGANVNQDSEGLLPLNVALSMQQFELAALLLDRGAQVSAADALMGDTPLMELSMTQSEDEKALSALAKRITGAGGNVDAQNKRGGTALMMSITSGNPVMVRILLELGANPNIKNAKGESPLAMALRRQREDLAGLLRQFGAQP